MLTNLSKFENRSSFRTWLYRMAVNHLSVRHAKGQRQKCIPLESSENL